jgi:hypothetical protein
MGPPGDNRVNVRPARLELPISAAQTLPKRRSRRAVCCVAAGLFKPVFFFFE